MLLKKRLRGGILLYALFMAAIFTLLLQVYLERVLASQRQNQVQIQASQSRLMASLTADLADNKQGSFRFDQGQASYEVQGQKLIVTVQTKDTSHTYHYVKKDQK